MDLAKPNARESRSGRRVEELFRQTEHAKRWLLWKAAPLWAERGRTKSGLFAERISLAGQPDSSYFRTFVQARHIFSFIIIGKMGWDGPWQELVGETLDVLIANAVRTDGLFVHRLDAQAQPLDHRADLYDQAFVLFALGVAGGALERVDCFDLAEALLDTLEKRWKHPLGGFCEGEIADSAVRRQNPHMHLLEALLALKEASGRIRFVEAAHEIAELARDRFIDPESGALSEYFTDDLQAVAGTEGCIAEPGHCFEWAWLFERLGANGWDAGRVLSDRLTGFARRCGIDATRNVAVNEVLTDGSVHNAGARLWPQTERLKAAVARLRRLNSDDEAEEVLAAALGLEQYLNLPIQGLWRDKLNPDGSWVEEFAPGSSLYHISCAYAELIGAAALGTKS
jgi:mannose-6-phosphate isomerase